MSSGQVSFKGPNPLALQSLFFVDDTGGAGTDIYVLELVSEQHMRSSAEERHLVSGYLDRTQMAVCILASMEYRHLAEMMP
jgi:hypothetical protein